MSEAEQPFYLKTEHGYLSGFSYKPKPTKKNPSRVDVELFYGAKEADPPHISKAIKCYDEETATHFVLMLRALGINVCMTEEEP